jgi:hypothetical protein
MGFARRMSSEAKRGQQTYPRNFSNRAATNSRGAQATGDHAGAGHNQARAWEAQLRPYAETEMISAEAGILEGVICLTKEWHGSTFESQIINIEVLPDDECNNPE